MRTKPILILVNNENQKFIYSVFRDDGSVYLYFPRKKGYLVTHDFEIQRDFSGTKQIALEPSKKEIINPYLSFHPGSKSIHINTSDKKIYRCDAKIRDLSNNSNHTIFNFCQIIPTDYSFLDTYSGKRKYQPPIIINEAILQNEVLSLEFWIHNSEVNFEYEGLPYYQIRVKSAKFIKHIRIENEDTNSLSMSIFIETLNKTEDKNDHGIYVNVLNTEYPFTYKLSPNFE